MGAERYRTAIGTVPFVRESASHWAGFFYHFGQPRCNLLQGLTIFILLKYTIMLLGLQILLSNVTFHIFCLQPRSVDSDHEANIRMKYHQ